MGEVIFNKDKIIKIDKRKVSELKRKASMSLSGKIRLCLHKDIQESLHEMIIVQRKDIYVRPHKHKSKTESFHLVDGSFFIILFNSKGGVISKIFMDDKQNEANFLCRIDANIWHTIVPISDFAIFHEITKGPYIGKKDSVMAPWAPAQNSIEAKKFINSLLK